MEEKEGRSKSVKMGKWKIEERREKKSRGEKENKKERKWKEEKGKDDKK